MTSYGLGGLDHTERDGEPVGELEGRSLLQVRLDLRLVHVTLDLVRDEHHDHIGVLDGTGDRVHLEAVLLGLVPGLAVLAHTDRDVQSAVVHAEGLCLALVPETDDRDLLALQDTEVGV